MKFLVFTLVLLPQSCLTEAKLETDSEQAGAAADLGPAGDSSAGLVSYDAKCASCHQPIESSAKAGSGYAAILNAGDIGAHAGVSPWPGSQESADLAAALAPPADAAAGLLLYESDCAMCHNPIDSSNKAGTGTDAIFAAADHPSHGSVSPWPDETESANLAAALAE